MKLSYINIVVIMLCLPMSVIAMKVISPYPISYCTENCSFNYNLNNVTNNITNNITNNFSYTYQSNITNVTNNGDGTYTWYFSDGYNFTTSNLTGQQGIPGINGTNGINGINGTFQGVLNETQFFNQSNLWSINLTWLGDWINGITNLSNYFTKNESDERYCQFNQETTTYEFYSSYSPLAYNGTNFTYVMFINSQNGSGIPVEEDMTLIPEAEGNYSLLLLEAEKGYQQLLNYNFTYNISSVQYGTINEVVNYMYDPNLYVEIIPDGNNSIVGFNAEFKQTTFSDSFYTEVNLRIYEDGNYTGTNTAFLDGVFIKRFNETTNHSDIITWCGIGFIEDDKSFGCVDEFQEGAIVNFTSLEENDTMMGRVTVSYDKGSNNLAVQYQNQVELINYSMNITPVSNYSNVTINVGLIEVYMEEGNVTSNVSGEFYYWGIWEAGGESQFETIFLNNEELGINESFNCSYINEVLFEGEEGCRLFVKDFFIYNGEDQNYSLTEEEIENLTVMDGYTDPPYLISVGNTTVNNSAVCGMEIIEFNVNSSLYSNYSNYCNNSQYLNGHGDTYFYPYSNPAGYITSSYLSSYVLKNGDAGGQTVYGGSGLTGDLNLNANHAWDVGSVWIENIQHRAGDIFAYNDFDIGAKRYNEGNGYTVTLGGGDAFTANMTLRNGGDLILRGGEPILGGSKGKVKIQNNYTFEANDIDEVNNLAGRYGGGEWSDLEISAGYGSGILNGGDLLLGGGDASSGQIGDVIIFRGNLEADNNVSANNFFGDLNWSYLQNVPNLLTVEEAIDYLNENYYNKSYLDPRLVWEYFVEEDEYWGNISYVKAVNDSKILVGESANVSDFVNAQFIVSSYDSEEGSGSNYGLVFETSTNNSPTGAGYGIFGVSLLTEGSSSAYGARLKAKAEYNSTGQAVGAWYSSIFEHNGSNIGNFITVDSSLTQNTGVEANVNGVNTIAYKALVYNMADNSTPYTFFGEGGDMYNDGKLNITKEVYIGGNTQLYGDGTYWGDVLVPLTNAKQAGINDPDFDVFQGSTRAYEFQDNGLSQQDEIYFTVQLPHSYKLNSEFSGHLHLSPDSNSSGVGNFSLECSFADTNGNFTNYPLHYAITNISNNTRYKNYMVGFNGNYSCTDMSCIGNCELERQSDSAIDDYPTGIFVHAVDFHIEMDSLGSNTEYVKT